MGGVSESAAKWICHARQVTDYYVPVTIIELSEVIIYLWRDRVPEPAQLFESLPGKIWRETEAFGGR